jgi:hypothetical protein
MRRTSTLARLDSGMLGEAFANLAPGDRHEAYTCVQMIQLMENVYLDLQFEDTWDHADNQGWRTLFTIWANAPAVRETWNKTSQMFGVRFQYFWRRCLERP